MADEDRGDAPADTDDAPGGLSILRAKNGSYATKQYSLGRNGKLRKSSYGNAKWFSVTTAKVGSIVELAAQLDRLQHDPHAFLVRGSLLPEADPQHTRRLLHPDPKDGYPASFRSACRQYLDIDFDGIPTPIGIDPVADPEGAIEYLIGLLPPEFQDATCWWQWTSSQGFKPDTLNARIYVYLDRPIPDEDLIRWARAINKAAGRKLIDDALYRAVQPHYVAAPIISGMPDPVPRRSGLRKGLDDAVALVLPEKTSATTAAEQSGEGIVFRETVGFEAYLGRIGDPDGFNLPIYKAIWSYVGSNGTAAATQEGRATLKARLKETIEAAAPGSRTQADIDRYASDAYLDSEISRVLARKEQDQPDQPEPPPPVPPHYPAEPLPLDQAKALLKETVVDWVGHAVTHDDGIQARQVGIKGAAGTGKTTVSRDVLEAFPETQAKSFYYFVPQHRLAKEFQREAEGGPLRVKVIQGRERKQADGSTLCAKADEAGKVAKAGFSVWESMCRRVDPETGQEEVCEHFATCPYVAQFDDPEPAVRIMAHEAMFLPRNSGLPKPDAVIIDESFHAKAVREANFELDRLNAGLPRNRKVGMGDLDKRDRIARVVRSALEAGDHPRDHGVTVEDCRFVATLEIGTVDGIGITPGMDHATQRKRLDGYRRSESLKLYRFWKILEVEIEREGPLRQIEFRPNWKRSRDDEEKDRIYLFWRRDLELPDVPVLVLDADLDPTIARKFLPRLEVVEVPVERCAEVIQVSDTACSRQRLLGGEKAPATEVSRAANRLADVQALFDVEAARGARVLLVTYKPVRARLKVPAGCAVDHYGNIRGTDDYKDFDTVIDGGREQPRVDAVEAQARALFADDPEPLILTGELMEVTRGYRMRDGSSVSGKVMVHVDPRVQAVLEQVRERGSGQTIDRLRLIHCLNPKRVIELSNVVLDLTVDRLTTWKEIMPSRLEQAAARGPAVPLSATELHRCFDDLWVSEVAAKFDLQRKVNGSKPHIEEFLYGKSTHLNRSTHLKVFYRRLGQKGRASPAIIRADAGDPRAALESVVGPVTWFELDEPVQAEMVATREISELAEVDEPDVDELDEPPRAVEHDLTSGGTSSRTASELNRDISHIDDAPPGGVEAPPAEEALPAADPVLDQLQRIIASAGRLADLSARLDYARPPRRWGDLSDALREQQWRTRMAALHELPMAAGGCR
jgi:hypothetical protein